LSGNFDAAVEFSRNHLAQLSLRSKGTESQARFECRRWRVGDIQMCDFSYGDADVEGRIHDQPERKFFLVRPLLGKAEMRLVNRHHVIDNNFAIVFEAKPNSTFLDTGGFRNLNIGIPYAALDRFLADEMGAPLAREISFANEPLQIDEALRSFLDYISWVTIQLDTATNEPVLGARLLGRHVQDTLLALLISTTRNNYRELYAGIGGGCIAPKHVRDAETYMREHVRSMITIRDVAEAIGIAARTLHLGFQKSRGYSPGQFLRDERLALARRELARAAEDGRSVTGVALDCGFSHLGNFSKHYVRKYGERPSETLKQGM
jgi:AraC-like DNA-binding protein